MPPDRVDPATGESPPATFRSDSSPAADAVGGARPREVFISYSSQDAAIAKKLAADLAAEKITVWWDRECILGGDNYGPSIVRGIADCRVLLLLCTSASMRSHNVKQEIQLAWKYRRPYLPVRAEAMDGYPQQVEYWLEGCQWLDVFDRDASTWMPALLRSLRSLGVGSSGGGTSAVDPADVSAGDVKSLADLRKAARFTDSIWPVRADAAGRGGTRDMGEAPPDAQHSFRLGDRVRVAIETGRAGHLLLIDEGSSGRIYCLCPSLFAPDASVSPGITYLPSAGARYDAFVLTGRPGREHLTAFVTDEPLGLDWLPTGGAAPARVLDEKDIEALVTRLRARDASKWTALSTYFDISK